MKDNKYAFWGVLIFLTLCLFSGIIEKSYKCKNNSISLTDTIYVYKTVEITNHQKYKLAIAMTESELNPNAIGKTNDFGIFQITPIWCAEVNRILGEERYSHTDAFNVKKSCEMWDVMYNGKNLDEIIKIHNPNAPKSYSDKVYSNLQKVNVLCEILGY